MAPPAHAATGDDLPRALAWMVLSGLCFALMGASVKFAGDLPVAVKVFFRNLVTLAITAAVAVADPAAIPSRPTPTGGGCWAGPCAAWAASTSTSSPWAA